MSHSIEAYLFSEEHPIPETWGEKLPQGIRLVFADNFIPEDLDELLVAYQESGARFKFAYITTDYFGGWGSQDATLYGEGRVLWKADSAANPDTQPVNEALEALGVVPEGDMDAWDTVGLGGYRRSGFDEGAKLGLPEWKTWFKALTKSKMENNSENGVVVRGFTDAEGYIYIPHPVGHVPYGRLCELGCTPMSDAVRHLPSCRLVGHWREALS